MNFVGAAILAVLAAVGLVAFYRTASEPTGAMSRDDFARSTRLVSSAAREASVFVSMLGADRLTHSYAHTEREKLLEGIRDEARNLREPAPAQLRAEASRARALAGDLERAVAETQPQEGDRDALAQLQAQLARIADELASLASAP
jgi:hypothetical protein